MGTFELSSPIVQSTPIPMDPANAGLACARRTGENNDLVISSDKAPPEKTADEAATASNDDSTCHVNNSPKTDFAPTNLYIRTGE